MKKLFHPGMIAIIAITAITVSSCSKSTNDLVATEKTSKKEPVSLNQDKYATLPDNFVDGMSKFYSYINQPIEIVMGNPDSYLPAGKSAVIYVCVASALANEPASDAMLTTRDDDTGLDIQEYKLISYKEADSYDLKIPNELIGRPFMFAIVELDDQYIDRTVALHSEITVNEITSVAQFDHAFTVIQQ